MDANQAVARKSCFLNGMVYLGCGVSCNLNGFLLKVLVRPHHQYRAKTWELTNEFVTAASYSLSAMCYVGTVYFVWRGVRHLNIASKPSNEQKEEEAKRQREWDEEYARAQAWLKSGSI
jgi:hypothetical protein